MIFFLAVAFAFLLASPAAADPISTAIAAISAFAQTAIGAIVVNAAISMGLSIVAQFIAKKNQPQNNGGLIVDRPTSGDTTCANFILGHYATPGNYTAPPYTGGRVGDVRNAFMTMVRDVSDIRVDGFVGIWINEDWVPLEPWVDDDGYFQGFHRPISGSKYDGEVGVRFYTGDQTVADEHLIEVSQGFEQNVLGQTLKDPSLRPWTSDMIGRDVAYAVIVLEYDQDKMPSEPDLLFEVRGIHLYDPRKDSTVGGSGTHRYGQRETYEYTENPVVMIYNIQRGIQIPGGGVWGGDIEPEGLPLDNWFAAMNKCDVPRASDGKPTYRAAYNVLIGPEEFGGHEPAGVIEELLLACSGSIAEVAGGRWHIRVGAPDLPVAFFTDNDIVIDDNEIFDPFPSIDEIVNGIQSQHADPNERWAAKQLPTRYSAEYEAEDQNRRLLANISMPAVTDDEQGQFIMRSMLEDARRMRRHELTLPPDYVHITPLDTIAYASEDNGYVQKLFEVGGKGENSTTLNVRFSLRERDPDDYDWNGDFLLPTPLNPIGLDPVRPTFGLPGENWDGFIIVDHEGNARKPGALLTWNLVKKNDVVGVSWQVATIGGGIIVSSGTMNNPLQNFQIISEGIVANGEYQGRAKLETEGGRVTEFGAWQPFIAPDVKSNWRDIEIDITQDLDQLITDLNNLEIRVDENKQLLDDLTQDATDEAAAVRLLLQQERQAMLDEAAAIRGEIVTLQNGISADMDTLEDTLIDRMGTEINTGITNYDVVVQGQLSSMAGQIESLTAVLSSADLLQNGSFADGALTYWTATGTVPVITRAGSANTLVLNAPTAYMVEVGSGEEIEQETANFTLTANDRFRIRFSAASPATTASNRVVLVTATWLTDAGVVIGTPDTTSFTMPSANTWGVYTHEFDPPDTAVRALLEFKHNGTGNLHYYTAFQANTADTSVEASLITLEGTVADLESAFAAYQQTVSARFGTVEASITSEAGTRANADGALSLRIDTVEADIGTVEGQITTLQTAGATQDQAIASLVTEVSAIYGSIQQVRDPDFSRDFTYWPHGGYGNSSNLVNRDKQSANWIYRDMPGRKAFRVDNASGTAYRGTVDFEVTPGEKFDFGFWAGKEAGGPTVTVTLRWLNATGGNIGSNVIVTVDPPTGAWGRFTRAEAIAPSGARYARLMLNRGADGAGPGASYLTAFEARRWSVTDAISAASIKTVSDAVADVDDAFAAYQVTVNTRFGTNETNISNEITNRTNADSALGTRIDNLTTRVGTNESNISTTATSMSTLSGAMAALEEKVTAMFGDTQLVRDPDFGSTLAYWSTGTLGTTTNVVNRNKASGSWWFRDMPGRRAFLIQDNAAGKRYSPPFEVSPSEVFDVGFYVGRVSGGPTVRVSVEWLDAVSPTANVIATASLVSNKPSGSYQYHLMPELVPPALAKAARVTFERGANGTGANTYVTKITMRRRAEFETISSAAIKSAETVASDAEEAVAELTSTVNTRVGNVETTLGATEIARVLAGGQALGARVAGIRVDVDENYGLITEAQQSIANTNLSLSNYRQDVQAIYGSNQLVRDPEFSRDTAYWGGNLGDAANNVFDRDVNSGSWMLSGMPGVRAFRIENNASGTRSSTWFRASETEKYDLSFYAGHQSNSPRIRVYLQFRDKDGNIVNPVTRAFEDTAFTPYGRYVQYALTDIQPGPGTVEGRVVFHHLQAHANPLSNHYTYLTGITVKRQAAFEEWSKARISENMQAIADVDDALAAYSLEVTSRFNRFTASGRLRVYSVAAFAGAVSRVGLTAEANEGENSTTAGIFLEAKSDGTSSVYIDANRFAFVTGPTNTAARRSPFFVEGGTVYMNKAMIKEADIDFLKIAGQNIFVPRFWTRANVTLGPSTSQSSPMLLFDRTLPELDGGGFVVTFDGTVNTRVDYDRYARIQILLDNVVVKTQSIGLRTSGANTGGEMAIAMSAGGYGNGTTNIKVRAWSHTHTTYTGGDATVVLQDMSLSVAGGRR